MVVVVFVGTIIGIGYGLLQVVLQCFVCSFVCCVRRRERRVVERFLLTR